MLPPDPAAAPVLEHSWEPPQSQHQLLCCSRNKKSKCDQTNGGSRKKTRKYTEPAIFWVSTLAEAASVHKGGSKHAQVDGWLKPQVKDGLEEAEPAAKKGVGPAVSTGPAR